MLCEWMMLGIVSGLELGGFLCEAIEGVHEEDQQDNQVESNAIQLEELYAHILSSQYHHMSWIFGEGGGIMINQYVEIMGNL